MRYAAIRAESPVHDEQVFEGQCSTTLTFKPAAANHASICSSVMLGVGVNSIMGTPYPMGVTENAARLVNRIPAVLNVVPSAYGTQTIR